MELKGILNRSHVLHLRQEGIKIKALKYHEIYSDYSMIVISDTLADSDHFSFSGITLATDFRLAGCRQPIVFLSFLNRQQLAKYDVYGIFQDSAIDVWTLPVIKDEFTDYIDSIHRTARDFPGSLVFKKIFQKRFRELFSIFLHGKSFDFINKITGPVRAACILTQYYPEKEALVWELFAKANQRLSDETSVQKLFFITSTVDPEKKNPENELSLHFVLLLKEFTGFKPKVEDIDKLIVHIDKLNHIFFQLTQKNG